MYQAAFFDVYNTLIGMHWPGKPHARRLPLQGAIERRLSRLDGSWQAAYGRVRGGEPGRVSPLTRLFAAAADHSGVARGSLFAPLHRNETTLRRWMNVYEDTVATLQALNTSCKLGIISNAWPYVESMLRLLGLWEYFHSVTISAQVGLSKPNPGIFELALRTLHVPAEGALFVDDMPQNVVAAEKVGIKGLWLVRSPMDPDSVPAPYRHLMQIQTLRQVIPLIENA
jgi:HAD superfamily hydrolase (TIGR01509 family)